MNIIIHGTKGGYRVLYSTPNTPLIAGDSRSAASNESVVGQSAYSIAFAANGCVLTKFVIVRDMIRNMATGNIAFSIYLPNSQKLPGVDAKSLLDQLSNHYCRMYAPDNNLENVHEDWSFVKELEGRYIIKNVSADDIEDIQQGTADAAFVYYDSDEEMQKYFDVPYQEEYSNYKQIFFVEKRMENRSENPLNALRHNSNANLTGKIDLDNPKYKLLFNERAKGGIKIEVKVKGNKRYNKNRIRKKDVIEISYNKDYHETQQQQGKWSEISPLFIEVNDNEQTINIKEIELQPREKIIPITVVDEQSKETIPNFRVICKSSRYSQPKEEINGQVVFEGSEIGESWHIEAMADGYKKEEGNINPENVPNLEFYLTEQKIFTIEVKDRKTNEIFSPRDYDVTVSYNGSNPQYHFRGEKNKIVFTGDEIGKEWYIEIRKNGFELSDGKLMIYPRNGDVKESINIYIEKKHQAAINNRRMDGNKKDFYFSFIAGKNGKIINDSQEYGPYQQYEEYKKAANQIEFSPKFGYKFDKLREIKSSEKHYTFKFCFKPIISLKLIISLGLVAVLGIMFFCFVYQPTAKTQMNENQIIQYIEGDSLILNTLNSYKAGWENQKPEIETKSNSVWYNPLTWFDNGESDSTNYRKWEETLMSIDNAIDKIESIDELDFEKIKELDYFTQQRNFKTTIQQIDNAEYESIKKQLDDVHSLTLAQIEDKIKTIQDSKVTEDEQSKAQTGEKEESPKQTQKSSNVEVSNPQEPAIKARDDVEQTSVSQDNASQIVQYLKGNNLKKKELEEYKNKTANRTLRASIDLALKFWKLDGKKNNSYSSYQGELNKDNNLKNSDLKRLVDSMCKKDRPKYVKELPTSDQDKNLTQIERKLQ